MHLEKIEKLYDEIDQKLERGVYDKDVYNRECGKLRDAARNVVDALTKNIAVSMDLQNYIREEHEQELTGDWDSKDHENFTGLIELFANERRKNDTYIILNVDDLNDIAISVGMTPPSPICEKGKEHEFAKELAIEYESWGQAIEQAMDRISKSSNHREFRVSKHMPFSDDIIKKSQEFIDVAEKAVKHHAIGNDYLSGKRCQNVTTGNEIFVMRESIGGISRNEPREEIIALVEYLRDSDGKVDTVPVPATYFPNLDKYYIDEEVYKEKVYQNGRPFARTDVHREHSINSPQGQFNNLESRLKQVYKYTPPYKNQPNINSQKRILHHIISKGLEPKTYVMQVLNVHRNFAGKSWKDVDPVKAQELYDYALTIDPPMKGRTVKVRDMDVIARKQNNSPGANQSQTNTKGNHSSKTNIKGSQGPDDR